MHRFIYPGLICIAISAFARAGGASAGHWPVEIHDEMDSRRVVVLLQDKDIEESPPWKPALGGPPLEIGAALERIHEWVARDTRLANTEVFEIELKPIQQHEQEDRWYYLVQLRDRSGRRDSEDFIAVLFNGKVVPAVVEPVPIK